MSINMKKRKCGKCGKTKNITAFWSKQTYCIECLKGYYVKGNYAERGKKRYHTKVSKGQCAFCKNPAKEGQTKCVACCWRVLTNKFGITMEQLDQLYDKQGGRCAISGVQLLKGINASLDHIIHRCAGGTNDISNLRLVTSQVNHSRLDYTDEEFIEMCKAVAEWNKA